MGVALITTVTAPAADYDLTDLATIKDELSLSASDTSKDAWLKRANTQVSALVRNYCNRVFQVEGLRDQIYIQQDPYPYQTPDGVGPLQLSRFPILSVSSVVQVIAVGTTQPLVAGTDYQIDYERGFLIRLNPFTGIATQWEALPVIVNYVAGYGSQYTQTAPVPASSPYTVTVTNAASFAIDQGVTYANGTALSPVAGSPSAGQYAADQDTGIYTFAAADAGASVVLNYAANEIPDDLVDVVLRVVTGRYSQRGRDPFLMEQTTPSVGTVRYWIPNGQNSALPPEITGLLDGTYRVPVLA